MSNKLKETEKSISEQEETIQQLDAEIQRIDEQTDEISRLTETWENERRILYEKRGFLTSAEEIQNIDERITDIERQLDRWEQDQNKLLEHRDEIISNKENHVDKLKKLKQIQNPTIMDNMTDLAKGAVKKAAFAPVTIAVQTVKGGAKSAATKANPFEKKINTNDVTDSGVESIRLAYTTVKKAKNSIKTVKSNIKTTKRTIKTTGKAAKATVKMAYKTPVFLVKTVIRAVRLTVTIVTNVVAALLNPVVFIIVAVLLMFLLILSAAILIFFGGESSNQSARTEAVGLVNVSEQYQEAENFFNIAVQSQKDAFYELIDGLYYSYDDLTHSNLVYMERTTADGDKAIYQTSFATDSRKNTLKSAWDFSADDVRGIIAVAYVYLEKQENIAHGTTDAIYEVTYTQEVFDMLTEKYVNFNDSVYGGQTCGTGCTRHVEIHHNPAYDEAVAAADHCWNAYLEWIEIAELIRFMNEDINDGAAQNTYWNNNIQWRIDNWKSVYFDSCYYSNNGYDYADDLYSWCIDSWDYMSTVPEEIEEVTYICEYQHDLHSVGLWYYSKESIMETLEFTNSEKEWVSLTEMGFESNIS